MCHKCDNNYFLNTFNSLTVIFERGILCHGISLQDIII